MFDKMSNKCENIDDCCLIIESTQIEDCIIIDEKNVNNRRKRRSDSVISLSSGGGSDCDESTRVDCIDLTVDFNLPIKRTKQDPDQHQQQQSQLNSPTSTNTNTLQQQQQQSLQSPLSNDIKRLIDDLNIDDLIKYLGDEIDSVACSLDTSNSSTTSTNSDKSSSSSSSSCDSKNQSKNESCSNNNNSNNTIDSIERIKKNLIDTTVNTKQNTSTNTQQQQDISTTPSSSSSSSSSNVSTTNNSSILINSTIDSNAKPSRPVTLPINNNTSTTTQTTVVTQQSKTNNNNNTLQQLNNISNVLPPPPPPPQQQHQPNKTKLLSNVQQIQQPTTLQPYYVSSILQQQQPQIRQLPPQLTSSISVDASNLYKNSFISSINFQPLFMSPNSQNQNSVTTNPNKTNNNNSLVNSQSFSPYIQSQPQYVQQMPMLPIFQQQQLSNTSKQQLVNNQQQMTVQNQNQINALEVVRHQTTQHNQAIHTYSRENPKIIIESGSILNCSRGSAIVNRIGSDKNLLTSGLLAQQLLAYCGKDLQKDLSNQRTNMAVFNDVEKTYPLIITNACKRIRCIFHVNLYQFDFTTDFSEIHFKKTVEMCLKAAIDNNITEITFPALGCGYLNYPASHVVKWFDECFSSFFLSYTCHTLQTVRIVLYEGDQYTINSFKTYYTRKSVMPITSSLSNSDKPDDHFELTVVDELSEEFKIVSTHFKSSLTNATIKRIERVRNVHLEDMYEQSKKMLKKRNPDNHLNEYKLFHGTSRDSIGNICRFGFNRSYCGKNGVLYGQGVYFARRASYSDRYSRMPNLTSLNSSSYSITNEYCMILARVLVGVYQAGNGNIKDPGMRPDGNQYDSTVDKIQSPEIFVIYRDYRAYPSYLIHYS